MVVHSSRCPRETRYGAEPAGDSARFHGAVSRAGPKGQRAAAWLDPCVQATAVAADRLNAQDPVTKLRHSGRTDGKKKYTKPATTPSPKLKGERPNGMGNSSFDIGICVSRCTGGGRAPGFRGRILRVTGTSRVGGLQVATLYQEILRRIVQLMSSIVVLAHKEAAARERAAAQEGIMSELHSLAQTVALQQERN
ncbi:hypothetical protein HPB50_002971 [Hyalomma asiaticum]|uniref:Uncharacterized protein n=1 Tax=Hyalomma asiaticum TaxID=266040 RepID=A0ACB7TE13_HYAAI|nr:hypothetical protein HPB50_002971 [Hyalomma asiaticum]